MGALNKKTGNYEAICKYIYLGEIYSTTYRIGTGFSDEDLANLTESLKDFQLNEKPANYRLSKTLKPDVWFTPSQVWEIECDKLSLSLIYQIGRNVIDPERGLSLRFPRFIRLRSDKTVNDSTLTSEVNFLF